MIGKSSKKSLDRWYRTDFSTLIFFLCVITCVGSMVSSASDETYVDLSADKTVVAPGRKIELRLTFKNGTDVPPPTMPLVEGVSFEFIKTEKKDEDKCITHFYYAIPVREGKYGVGPISFSYGGHKYVSNPIFIESTLALPVSRAPASGIEAETLKASITGQRSDFSGRIYIEVDIPTRDIFINENFPVTVRFYTDWLDIVNLMVSESPSDEYVSGEYAKAKSSVVSAEGKKFAVVEYRKWVFISEPGQFLFGPVRAGFDVTDLRSAPLNKDDVEFYKKLLGQDRMKHFKIENGPFRINVVEFPKQDVPPGFMGAVGSFSLSPAVDRKDVNVGEMITLTMKITGPGNYNTVRIPLVGKSEYLSEYAPRSERIKDGILFEQPYKVISVKANMIPEITFPYFDPEAGKYVLLRSAPISLNVKVPIAKGKNGQDGGPAAPDEIESTKPVMLGDKKTIGKKMRIDPFFYKKRFFWIMESVPAILLGAFVLARRRSEMLSSDTSYARWKRASEMSDKMLPAIRRLALSGKKREFYDRVFKFMQEYLACRLGMSSGGIDAETVRGLALDNMDDKNLGLKISGIFSACNSARYALENTGEKGPRDVLAILEQVLAQLNKQKDL